MLAYVIIKESKMLTPFGKWLKARREELGLSGRALAKYAGVSSGYISQVENGKRNVPTSKILQKLAKPLKVSIGEIYRAAGILDEQKDEQAFIGTNEAKNNISVQAAHKKVEIPISLEDLETVERFLEIARKELKKK